MQFYQLVQVFADVPPTLGTLHRSWSFFVHQGTASRTKPLATETVAFLGKSEVFRLLGLTHEPGVQALRHGLRQLYPSALAVEHAALFRLDVP
jgi:hypothetical protein